VTLVPETAWQPPVAARADDEVTSANAITARIFVSNFMLLKLSNKA
jgi:hypothetical protein